MPKHSTSGCAFYVVFHQIVHVFHQMLWHPVPYPASGLLFGIRPNPPSLAKGPAFLATQPPVLPKAKMWPSFQHCLKNVFNGVLFHVSVGVILSYLIWKLTSESSTIELWIKIALIHIYISLINWLFYLSRNDNHTFFKINLSRYSAPLKSFVTVKEFIQLGWSFITIFFQIPPFFCLPVTPSRFLRQ